MQRGTRHEWRGEKGEERGMMKRLKGEMEMGFLKQEGTWSGKEQGGPGRVRAAEGIKMRYGQGPAGLDKGRPCWPTNTNKFLFFTKRINSL